jgi:hypothetical protein
MSLPTALVVATAMICFTVLVVVVTAFVWASTHRS